MYRRAAVAAYLNDCLISRGVILFARTNIKCKLKIAPSVSLSLG
jgi:hypothetical protein